LKTQHYNSYRFRKGLYQTIPKREREHTDTLFEWVKVVRFLIQIKIYIRHGSMSLTTKCCKTNSWDCTTV